MSQQRGVDAAPVERSPALDAATFQAMYDSYGADCYRVARQVVRDANLAEDVVQNVFVALWRGTACFDAARGSVQGWLLMITHHKAVDLVRSNQRHTGPALTDEMLGGVQAVEDVEELGLRSARAANIAQALAKLTEVQREVILLSYYNGYSQSEIAQLTGTPLGTVKTRMVHALKKLRRDLALAALAVDEGWHRNEATA
jgi:RNA polymerase sigma factor (sigma-70 family)